MRATSAARRLRTQPNSTKLYAIVESPAKLAANDASNLQGVFVSANGNPAGPYTLIADSTKLENSGSALTADNSPGYEVGIQSWYNQALAVDPTNPNHIVVEPRGSVREQQRRHNVHHRQPVLELRSCLRERLSEDDPSRPARCDVRGRPARDRQRRRRLPPPAATTGYGHWTDLNARYNTLQYYDARQGRLGADRTGTWGGLQDNGTSLLDSAAAQQVEPAGGDGGDVIVDPHNANRMVGEYTDLTMYSTDNGGKTFVTTIGPSCVAQEVAGYDDFPGCDPGPRFIAPFTRR